MPVPDTGVHRRAWVALPGVPTISVLYGIVIRMFVKDDPPPHFHALYGGHRARAAIATGEPIDGEP